MDRLRDDDLDRAGATPPAVKLQQALELMATGIRLKRAALQHQHPGAAEDEIESLLPAWLQRED